RVRLHAGVPGRPGVAGQPCPDDLRRHDRDHEGNHRPVAGVVTVVTDRAVLQRRTLTVLTGTQIVGGVGVAIGISVGALLAAAIAGTRFSGLASSAAVVGAALLAIPATRLIRSFGRRPGLT